MAEAAKAAVATQTTVPTPIPVVAGRLATAVQTSALTTNERTTLPNCSAQLQSLIMTIKRSPNTTAFNSDLI